MSDAVAGDQPPSAPGTGDALVSLVGALEQAHAPDHAMTALLSHARHAAGAQRAVLLRSVPEGRLVVIADDASGLPPQLRLPDLRARMWRVLLGQAELAWDGGEDTPQPVADADGWSSGAAVLVPSRTGEGLLLLVGGTQGCPDTGTVECLRALSAAAGATLDTLELRQAQVATRGLLDRVADLATAMATASAPDDLLLGLTRELSGLDVIDAAVVWVEGDGDARLVSPGGRAVAQHVLPAVVAGDRDAVDERALARVARLLSGTASRAVVRMLSEAAELQDGRLLTLTEISRRPRRVLGLIHSAPLGPDERRVLATLTGSLELALEQAERSQERRSVLAMFGKVLRPVDIPPGVDVAVEHHPNTSAADVFGGDFYDWFLAGDNRLTIALGDVAGKGIEAAASSSMAVWSLRAIGRQGTTPALVAHLMDLAVSEELGLDRFVALSLADLALDDWTVRLVLAGQPPPILLGLDEPPEGLRPDRPLGVWPDGPAFLTRQLHIPPGGAIVLYTDGAMDAQDAEGVRLGAEALAAHAQHLHGLGVTPEELAQGLWRLVCDHGDGPPDDDCAIVVIGRPS